MGNELNKTLDLPATISNFDRIDANRAASLGMASLTAGTDAHLPHVAWRLQRLALASRARMVVTPPPVTNLPHPFPAGILHYTSLYPSHLEHPLIVSPDQVLSRMQ